MLCSKEGAGKPKQWGTWRALRRVSPDFKGEGTGFPDRDRSRVLTATSSDVEVGIIGIFPLFWPGCNSCNALYFLWDCNYWPSHAVSLPCNLVGMSLLQYFNPGEAVFKSK